MAHPHGVDKEPAEGCGYLTDNRKTEGCVRLEGYVLSTDGAGVA